MINKLIIIEKSDEGIFYVITIGGIELTNTITLSAAKMFVDGFLCYLYNKQIGYNHFYIPEDFFHLTGVWAAQIEWEKEVEKSNWIFKI